MLSEALRLLRVFHDLKQKDLAGKIGVTNTYISEIENDNRTPSLETLEKYADFFNIPLSSILFFAEQIEKNEANPKRIARAQNAIAEKIISFLQIIEQRT